MADAVRYWKDASVEEQEVAKLLYVTGQYEVAQLSRLLKIDYSTLRLQVARHGWHDEKLKFAKELKGGANEALLAMTDVFKLRTFNFVQKQLLAWDELLERFINSDTFHQFPQQQFWDFLKSATEFMQKIGMLKVAEVNIVNNNLNVDARQQVAIDGKTAQVALNALLQGVMMKARPPEINMQAKLPGPAPNPATGQHR